MRAALTGFAFVLASGPADAQFSAEQIHAQMQAQGYEQIELVESDEQIMVRAERDGMRFTIVYDKETGETVSDRVDRIMDPEGLDAESVRVRGGATGLMQRVQGFLGRDAAQDAENDKPELGQFPEKDDINPMESAGMPPAAPGSAATPPLDPPGDGAAEAAGEAGDSSGAVAQQGQAPASQAAEPADEAATGPPAPSE